MTFLDPAYGRRSIGDVVPAVATALGFDGLRGGVTTDQPDRLVLPDAPAYVIYLVDGLGQELLTRYAHAAPYLASLMGEPGTAGVPSTTATSLTSLGTGLVPGEHGLVGFTARVPGTEKLLNHLMWSKSVDPVEWQPHPTMFGQLMAAGLQVTSVSRREFDGSGLTVAAHRGADVVGADRVGERLAGVLAAAGRGPSLTYVYEGDLDWTGHHHGVASQAWLHQLAMIDAAVMYLRESLPSSVRLLVVADHGMVDSPVSSRVDVDDLLDLRDGVVLLGGEARFRHLYCQSGSVDDVLVTWRSILGDRALVLAQEDVIARGWLGPVSPAVRARVGDVIVACEGDHAIMSTKDFPYENRLIGLHGSLTRAEMLIPILID